MKFTTKGVTRGVTNAMNRTPTQTGNLQKIYILKEYGVKKKHIGQNRLKRLRARADWLRIEITSTQKYITPFMQESTHRPKVEQPYGIQKNQNSDKGRFFISSKNHAVRGYQMGKGKLRKEFNKEFD